MRFLTISSRLAQSTSFNLIKNTIQTFLAVLSISGSANVFAQSPNGLICINCETGDTDDNLNRLGGNSDKIDVPTLRVATSANMRFVLYAIEDKFRQNGNWTKARMHLRMYDRINSTITELPDLFTFYSKTSVSDDGNLILFNTTKSFLPSDTNGREDLYLYNRQLNTFELINLPYTEITDDNAIDTNSGVYMTPDGRYVSYTISSDTNYPGIGITSVRYDRLTGARDRISIKGYYGMQGCYSVFGFPMSADGQSGLCIGEQEYGNDIRLIRFGEAEINLSVKFGRYLGYNWDNDEKADYAFLSGDGSTVFLRTVDFPKNDPPKELKDKEGTYAYHIKEDRFEKIDTGKDIYVARNQISVSYDGKIIAYTGITDSGLRNGNNIVQSTNVYTKNLITGAVTLVSKDKNGSPGTPFPIPGYPNFFSEQNSRFPVISFDGKLVLFRSEAGKIFKDTLQYNGNLSDPSAASIFLGASDGLGDLCPEEQNITLPGKYGCVQLPDGDKDGTPDTKDECPNDPAKFAVGSCGCGQQDIDANSNGVIDCTEKELTPNEILSEAKKQASLASKSLKSKDVNALSDYNQALALLSDSIKALKTSKVLDKTTSSTLQKELKSAKKAKNDASVKKTALKAIQGVLKKIKLPKAS